MAKDRQSMSPAGSIRPTHAVSSVRSARPSGPVSIPDERWQRMWSHREQLLKIARRRSMSVEDAEDAVHEAMLRACENPHVDDERLGAWLTTVTMRLCVDRHRQVNREAEVGTRSTFAAPGPVPVEEAVCDRAEASWLARRSGELPARQAEALWLKSEDLDVGQVARKMGLSYRTVESLLARARRTLRNSLAGTLAAGACLWTRPRTGEGGLQLAGALSTVTALAVLGVALPPGDRPADPPPPPAPSVAEERPHPAANSPGSGSPPRPPAVPGGRGGEPGGRQVRPGSTGVLREAVLVLLGPEGVTGVPRAPLSEPVADRPLPLPSPEVRTGVPLPEAPRVPDLPDAPGLPDAPEASGVPEASPLPDAPDADAPPGAPPTGRAPSASAPDGPDAPDGPTGGPSAPLP